MNTSLRTPIPLASTAAAVVLTAYSVLKPPRNGQAGRELAIELVIVLLVAAIAFFATGRSVTSERPDKPSGRAALTLAIVGLLSVAGFAVGIFSVVLAGAAALLAREARTRASHTAAATAALAIAAVTVLLSVVIAIAA